MMTLGAVVLKDPRDMFRIGNLALVFQALTASDQTTDRFGFGNGYVFVRKQFFQRLFHFLTA